MKELFEIIGNIFKSAFSFVIALLKGAFAVKDSIDSVQDQIIAAALGIPLILISVAGIIITIVGIVRIVSRVIDRFL